MLTIFLTNSEWHENVMIIVLLYMLIIERNHITVLGEQPTDGVDDTTITTEAKYSISIIKSRNKIRCSLQLK